MRFPTLGFLTIACAAGLSALPVDAQEDGAACPRGPATETLYIDFENGRAQTRVDSDGNTIERDIGFGDQTVFEFIVHPIGLILEGWEIRGGERRPGTLERSTYVGTPETLPLPAPGVTWKGVETTVFSDGEVIENETSLEVGEMQTVSISPCEYDIMPITIELVGVGDGSQSVVTLARIEDLDVTIYLNNYDRGESRALNLSETISTTPPDTWLQDSKN